MTNVAPICSRWPFPARLATGALLVVLGCGSTPDPHGSLVSTLSDEEAGPPPVGRYECTFRFVRLEGDMPANSLASRHIQETSDRLYGQRPVSHASENCEVWREPGGAKYLVAPDRRRIRIRPISATAFSLEWDDRAEFRRIDPGTFQGEVRTISGVETVTLYHLGGDDGDGTGDPSRP